MEELKMLLENMQQEMRQQKTDMIEMKEDIKNTINNNINDKFSSLEAKNELLEEKIYEQSRAINNFERYIRRKNLIIFGVEEQEKTYHELENMIINIINTNFNFQFDFNNIEAVRRIGKKGENTRPIIITFSTIGLKIKIQINKKCLENTPYYIKEDYPKDVLIKRKELQVQLQKEINSGNKAFIKYDKLIVLNNKRNQISQNHTNNKRNLSESPETPDTNSQSQVKKQPPKKNKSTNLKNFIIQKPKLFYSPADNSQDQRSSTARP